MSIETKASRLLAKLYMIRRKEFTAVTVEDIISKATPAEIDFYYYKLIERV